MTKPPNSKQPPAAKPATKPSMPSKPAGIVKPAVAAHTPKTFSIVPWTGSKEGRKLLGYAKSGSGKSTLAAQLANAIFFGLDDGARKIQNPITGEPVKFVPGVESFQDIRDALHQNNLFDDNSTIVFDTVTKLEPIIEPYLFQHYKTKNGTATNMRAYGWDGPAHLLDAYRLLLSDLDAHVRVGRNVLLLAQLAQVRVANAEGSDYLEDGPKLQHNNQYSVRTELCEWADDVFRIGYASMTVSEGEKPGKAGKVTSTDATRAIYTGGAQHFIAKSRPVNGYRIPTVIGFDNPADNSLWQFIFEGARVEE